MQIKTKNKPRPPGDHGFWCIMKAWTILVEGHQSNIPAKLHWTQSNCSYEIFKVFYIDI